MSKKIEKKTEIPRRRTSSLLSMAAKLAFKESKNFVQSKAEKRLSTMLSQAETVVQHVGQLKGAAMKAVQMITIESQDFLPPEVIKVLEKLQSQAPPIDDETMKTLLKKELGEVLFSKLENLSDKPIAAASIGQVYQARLNGKDVVVKVQYPGIAESVDSDLAILKKIIKTLLFVSNKRIDIDELFEEVTRILKLETDYKNEAESLLKYAKNFEGSEKYRIPKIYNEFTTHKVLVMSKEEGLEFTPWFETSPSRSEKDSLGYSLLNLYIKEFFENQFVQTDPNPANFLINEDSQLVLLDFGATLNYTKKFEQDYRALLKTVFQKNDSAILKKLIELGFVSEKESDSTQKDFVDFMKISALPFDEDQQPFEFAKTEYSNDVRGKALDLSRKLKFSAPPKNIIFLHRKLGGIFLLLKKLEVQIDLSPFREMILEDKIKTLFKN